MGRQERCRVTETINTAPKFETLLAGEAREEALAKTTGSVVTILNRATERGSDELMLETDRQVLTRPQMVVDIERVAEPVSASH